jgi:predicted  nucleic acid-binding Zn-ribbon protein
MQIFVKLQNYTTMKEFIELVREMRNAQKEYFKIRSKDVLNRSKELERKVDAELQSINNTQQTLFQ